MTDPDGTLGRDDINGDTEGDQPQPGGEDVRPDDEQPRPPEVPTQD